MTHWLYRYIFRGFGILFVIGMITFLILAVNSMTRRPEKRPAAPAADTRSQGRRPTK